MSRPLLLVALVYTAGVLAADFARGVIPVLGTLLAGAFIAITAIAWSAPRSVLTWILVFIAGAANLSRQQATLAPNDLRRVAGEAPAIATIRGRLVETPYHRHYEHVDEEVWRTLARIDVESVRFGNGEWQTASSRIVATTPGIVASNFFGGRHVEIEGVLRPPRGAIVEGLFDYAEHLTRQGIHYQLDVEQLSDWRLTADSPASPPVADRFGQWAKQALALGLPVEDQPLQLLWAMTLGWKTALSGEVSEPFMRSGTMHVFAISGLHIALIAGLLVAALRVARVPRPACAWMVLPIIWFYTGVTGWQASAIRSTIMMTVILGGWMLQRPSDLVNSLAGAALLILLWDPQQLFQAGFQLSFAVVFSLALIAPLFHAISAPVLDPTMENRSSGSNHWSEALTQKLPILAIILPDPFQLRSARPRWQRWTLTGLRYLAGSFITSFAAWIGSIPVVAWHFNLLTPVSLLANIIVVPLSSAALACNLAALATAAWLPGAAELFNHAAWFFMVWMIRISEWCAELPAGCFHVRGPSLPMFLLYYAALAGLLTGLAFRPRIRIGYAVVLTLLSTWLAAGWWNERQSARLTVLPLNGGEAIYFEPAHGEPDLLVDCGSEFTSEFVLKPFLRSRGVDYPDTLVLTHGDARNVGGAALMQARFTPRRVVVSDATFRSGAYRDAVRSFDSITGHVERIAINGQMGTWTILHPGGNTTGSQADDNALVLFGEVTSTRILLLSDLSKPGQHALLTRWPELRADIVIGGLPTSAEPLAEAFLDAVQPKLIIVTDAEFPAMQRASLRLQERLRARDVPVVFTHQAGAVTLWVESDGWVAKARSGETWRYLRR